LMGVQDHQRAGSKTVISYLLITCKRSPIHRRVNAVGKVPELSPTLALTTATQLLYQQWQQSEPWLVFCYWN
jgi:hypothetical protein